MVKGAIVCGVFGTAKALCLGLREAKANVGLGC